jgi:hypothetical protein
MRPRRVTCVIQGPRPKRANRPSIELSGLSYRQQSVRRQRPPESLATSELVSAKPSSSVAVPSVALTKC